MATTQSADEAKQAYVASMGESLGSIFHALWQEVAWLHFKWREYVVLGRGEIDFDELRIREL